MLSSVLQTSDTIIGQPVHRRGYPQSRIHPQRSANSGHTQRTLVPVTGRDYRHRSVGIKLVH
ncbi:hypothetical protein AWC26_05225 [Mycobacterium shimoidei]|nr:hypothetical protein AWC26_05225 [Mycobacterium shimoidei]